MIYIDENRDIIIKVPHLMLRDHDEIDRCFHILREEGRDLIRLVIQEHQKLTLILSKMLVQYRHDFPEVNIAIAYTNPAVKTNLTNFGYAHLFTLEEM